VIARALVVAAAVAVPVTAGGQASETWEVRLPAEVEAAAARAGAASLTILGRGGRVVSSDGPVRIDVASASLQLPRTRYDRRHAADPAADAPRFDLRFTAPDAGDHELAVSVRFWVCGPRTCRPVRVSRTVVVRARARPAP
jgi:hypothetical protein